MVGGDEFFQAGGKKHRLLLQARREDWRGLFPFLHEEFYAPGLFQANKKGCPGIASGTALLKAEVLDAGGDEGVQDGDRGNAGVAGDLVMELRAIRHAGTGPGEVGGDEGDQVLGRAADCLVHGA